MLNDLISHFQPEKKYTLLFSGGLDSSAVLGAAVQANTDVQAIYIDSGMNRMTSKDAKQQASNLGCNNFSIREITINDTVKQNPAERCYHCKLSILKTVDIANRQLLDGTNSSDSNGYRPGHKALKEMSVQSPLKSCNIDGKTAKEIAIQLGADPTIAGIENCLATRINYGLSITDERLDTIRRIEMYIIQHTADYNCRCRMDDTDHLRIELSSQNSFDTIVQSKHREKISELNDLTMFTALDIKPYRPNEYDSRL